jgi:hypothetical protein
VRTEIVLSLACALACSAQQWEIGAAAGYGTYRNGTIFSPAGKARAGVRNRFAVSALMGEDMYAHMGGEVRYTYQDGDPFLSARGIKTNIEGQSHSFHYDALFHLRGRHEKIRPYVAAGIGVKVYVVSGPPNPRPPLGDIAVLTTHDQARPLVTGGGGVKLKLGHSVLLRLDFRDYITPFPKELIAPAPFNTARGFFHQFTPLIGISYVP